MPVISRTDTIALNARSLNVLAGEQFEFLGDNTIVTLSASAAAVGIAADMNIGGVAVLANAVVPDTNRFPVKPDDTMESIGGTAGSRLFLTYLNTTGAPINVNTLVNLDPV